MLRRPFYKMEISELKNSRTTKTEGSFSMELMQKLEGNF